MKVLHYVNENNLTWAASWISLIKGLEGLGADNVVLCKRGGSLSGMLKDSAIRCEEADVLIAGLPATAREFGAVLRNESPDIIHTRLSSGARIGGWWGKKLGIPVISTLDKFAKIKYYRNCNVLAACSNAVFHDIIGKGFPQAQVEVIHNPIDPACYRPVPSKRLEIRETLNIGEGTLITAAGRFDKGKGFESLVKACAPHLRKKDGTKLLLLGDGPLKENIIKLAGELGCIDKIIMPGFVRDVRPWLWASDLFLFPSDAPDTFGLSLLEAMASGLPVIATDCGGPREIMPQDLGYEFIVPMGDCRAMGRAISLLLSNPDLRSSLGEKSARRAMDFGIKQITQITFNCYQRILNEGNAHK